MPTRHVELQFCDDRARRAFAAAGIDSLADLCAGERGETVTRAATRRCARLELDDDVYFVKTQDVQVWRLPPQRWPSYLLRGSPLRRERHALATLSGAGFATPTVVAAGASRPGALRVRAALVTRAVPGHVDLARWSGTPAADDDGAARATFDAAEALVARAHGLGLVLGGAKYRNFLVPVQGCADPAAIVVLDQPSLRRSGARRLRERDVALLAFDRHRYGRGR